MLKQEITDAVKAIMTKIRAASADNVQLVSFDFAGGSPMIVSRAIQQLLSDKGYIVVVVLGGKGPMTERMYVDLSRQRVREAINDT